MADKSISQEAVEQLAVFGAEVSGVLAPLLKTPHSKNITLSDWNEFLHVSDRTIADVKRLYEVLKEAIPALEGYIATEVTRVETATANDFKYVDSFKTYDDLHNAESTVIGGVYTVQAGRMASNTYYPPYSLFVKIRDGRFVPFTSIPFKGITWQLLANGAVTTGALNDGAVTTDKLADNSVTEDKIVDSAVTSSKIANFSINTSKLVTGSVTTAKIATGNVTEETLSEALKSKLGGAFNKVEYNSATGVLTFTKAEGGDPVEINLPLEQLITGGRYDEESQDIVLTMQNGDELSIPLDAVSENLISHVTTEFTKLENKINAVRDSIYEVQIAPPLERLVNAMVLPAPTLSVLANIKKE